MPSIYTLFFIVFLEGYIVLSAELLAIRQTLPFVGSGTDTTAILIASVLVPLALGYYTGGHHKQNGKARIRGRLLRNLALSAVILFFGLSYFSIRIFHESITDHHIHSVALITALYGAIFIAPPTYFLGQTIPLISNYLPKEKLSQAAGKILFFSTLGSFAGAVFSTLVLMAYIGVHHTITITLACVFILTIILSKKLFHWTVLLSGWIVSASIITNGPLFTAAFNVVQDNHYNLVQIQDYETKNGLRTDLQFNHTHSASLEYDTRTGERRSAYKYIRYFEDRFINTDPQNPPKDILILGAGGFTVGNHDQHNLYTYIDIDEELLETAQTHLLQEMLPANKTFIAKPARPFLNGTQQKFDLIFADLTHGKSGTPDHLTTKEFFQQMKGVLKENGIVVLNKIVTPNFADTHAVVIDNTIRSVFPNVMRVQMYDYAPWDKRNGRQNVIYSYFHGAPATTRIYTDDLNRQMFDKDIPP